MGSKKDLGVALFALVGVEIGSFAAVLFWNGLPFDSVSLFF